MPRVLHPPYLIKVSAFEASKDIGKQDRVVKILNNRLFASYLF